MIHFPIPPPPLAVSVASGIDARRIYYRKRPNVSLLDTFKSQTEYDTRTIAFPHSKHIAFTKLDTLQGMDGVILEYFRDIDLAILLTVKFKFGKLVLSACKRVMEISFSLPHQSQNQQPQTCQ
jgi:hypothetical protein